MSFDTDVGLIKIQVLSALHTFIIAMILHPSVQMKAQAELDSVVGRERLPDHSDKPNLPYLGAVLTEGLRWRPVAPLGKFHVFSFLSHSEKRITGLAHTVSKADDYKGYSIPKGTIIVPNVWLVLNQYFNCSH